MTATLNATTLNETSNATSSDPSIDLSLMPTEADIAFYREHGWWMSQSIFSDEELDAAIDLQERVYAGDLPVTLPTSDRRSTLHTPNLSFRPHELRKTDYSTHMQPELKLISHKPILSAIAAALMDSESIRLWHDQLLFKPPHPGTKVQEQTAVGWHADRNHWQTCTGPLVTAWVPFTDVSPEMGPIAFLDKSQEWDLIEELDFFTDDLEKQMHSMKKKGHCCRVITPTYRRGQVTFHDWRTVHGSMPNYSGIPRRSMAVHMQDGRNRYRVVTKADGTLYQHAMDSSVRLTKGGHPDYSDPFWNPVLFKA